MDRSFPAGWALRSRLLDESGFRHAFLPWEEKQAFVRMARASIPRYA